MICPRCQTLNPPHAAFCLSCGFKLELLRETSSAPDAGASRGLGVTSLVIGSLSFLTCSLFFVGALVAMAFGVIAIVRANSNPDHYGGKGLALGGIALSVLSLIGGVVLFFRIVPQYYEQQIASNEWAAYNAVKRVGWCQARYFEKNNRYGTIADMIAADLIEDGFIESKREEIGYRIEVRVWPEFFEVVATPVKYGTTGRASLYLTTDYLIRIADKKGLEAGARDPAFY